MVLFVSWQVIRVDDCPQNTQVNSEPAEISVWDEQEKHSKNWLTVSNFSQLSMLHVAVNFRTAFKKKNSKNISVMHHFHLIT